MSKPESNAFNQFITTPPAPTTAKPAKGEKPASSTSANGKSAGKGKETKSFPFRLLEADHDALKILATRTKGERNGDGSMQGMIFAAVKQYATVHGIKLKG